MFIFALLVVFKLVRIQFVQGNEYRNLAQERTIKDVEIPAKRGNVYSADGNLLATSVSKFDIRFDAITPSDRLFDANLKALSDSLAKFHGRSSSYYMQSLRKARINKNRYHLLARNLGYSEYLRFRTFPLLNLRSYKGGVIVEQKTKREHPMGGIAQRSIGYERFDDNGNVTRAGIDGAFGEKYLRGVNGKQLMQRIGNGQWKPIEVFNQVEPKDGYDVHTTINVNIQDIAHHALLEQLEYYEADHGCVVVMETKTGEIRAISNLAKTESGSYYEKRNYAVWESLEPGSIFKLMSLAVALDDKVVDTSDVVDTERGVLSFYGNKVRDSRNGGYGKISISEAFEVSSNTGIVRAIHDNYTDKPQKFIDGLYDLHLNKKLDLPIIGEGAPEIADPRIKDSKWSGIALEWTAYGYNVKLTPLQALTFYNAIANDGEMVKPRFLQEVKQFGRTIESFDKEVIDDQVVSPETVSKLQKLMLNVVEKKHGTGNRLYSKNFSMAGKTGTAQTEYWMSDWQENKRYVSSFAGYFPAEDPKYSCIVVIHKPSIKKGYYGADVSGPVFKKIAQKIYTDTPLIDSVNDLEASLAIVDQNFDDYYQKAQKYKTIMPEVKGMPAMDAVSLLENMGLQVRIVGSGKVKSQSIPRGTKIKENQTVVLQSS
jgi:cell division protein FtsI (penicillin-binding protein 3)